MKFLYGHLDKGFIFHAKYMNNSFLRKPFKWKHHTSCFEQKNFSQTWYCIENKYNGYYIFIKKKRYPIRISFCVTSTLFKDLLTANCWTIILIQGKTRFPNLSFTAALSKSQRFRLSLKICLYYHTITKITKLKLFTYQDEKT